MPTLLSCFLVGVETVGGSLKSVVKVTTSHLSRRSVDVWGSGSTIRKCLKQRLNSREETLKPLSSFVFEFSGASDVGNGFLPPFWGFLYVLPRSRQWHSRVSPVLGPIRFLPLSVVVPSSSSVDICTSEGRGTYRSIPSFEVVLSTDSKSSISERM